MNTHTGRIQDNKSQSVANMLTQKQNVRESTFQFIDNRPEAIMQRKIQKMADDLFVAPIQKKENNTGLPDTLKSGIENLSGYSMDDVKVHYNSDKPAQLNAHAYAHGTDIHLASGQERHLPHEAWHVVQQKQGRVKPTMQMKGKVNVNDDPGLEKEADVMGARALQLKSAEVNSCARSTHSYNSIIYQLIEEDQQAIRDDGNRAPTAYQETNPDNLESTKGHVTTWGNKIPTLKQFETATSKFWALRRSDTVLTQIDGLLAKFNQLGNTQANMAMKEELVQEMVLACEFWLKKVNKAYKGKKPVAAAEIAKNLGGDTLKSKGEEERRPGIFALRLACTVWLTKKNYGGTLDEIVNDRSLQNRGVTDEHENKDVVYWEKENRGLIFPQHDHQDDWDNSRGLNDGEDYVVLQNEDQKRTAKLVFRGGTAYRWQEVLNSNSKFGIYTSGKEKHFAMDKRGRIFTGTLGMIFFHSSLLGFADALSAGMMTVNNGRVVYISNDSGHYKPNVEAMVRVLRQLQRYGTDVSNIKVARKYVPDLDDATFTGAEILASDHSKWPDQ